jgi:hypothetical protein
MNYQHPTMAEGRWLNFSLSEQMANIGSEVFRAINHKNTNDKKSAQDAFERALELFDLTLQDYRNRGKFIEIARARETFVDYFKYDNQYNQTPESISRYFFYFNYLARLRKL